MPKVPQYDWNKLRPAQNSQLPAHYHVKKYGPPKKQSKKKTKLGDKSLISESISNLKRVHNISREDF